jgi:hypothetical protein
MSSHSTAVGKPEDVTHVSEKYQAVMHLNPVAYTHASVKPSYKTKESKAHYKRNADIPVVSRGDAPIAVLDGGR